ncbi:hypothetical protein C8J55DRAFT_562896 [Lentinula edodes]|uniref:Uncharacterized protein n=1 Tax=Lentinula lateritia TaxID=40482 RepID=A0A9W9A4J0_9AGAR|nr:hypothetical protein C8J55DRAFT_562896 [Lentinula edodes]
MAPQRTPRRLASVHHHFSETPNVSPRRHPMLLRSMATPDAPTADTSHSIQETSDSLLGLNSSTTNPSDLSAYPPSHSLLGASGSLIIPNSASSDAPLHSSGELPSKPVVPVELMTTTDGNSIRNLEMFCTHSQRLYNEQKNSLEFTKQCIDLVEQQCTDLTKIKHMRSVVQKFNYSCPFCKDLAWNAHVYVSIDHSFLVNSADQICTVTVYLVDTLVVRSVSATSDNNTSRPGGSLIVQYAGFLFVENPYRL